MRINKYISNYSQYSRRKADELIEEGEVSVNGKVVVSLGIDIDPQNDQVKVKGTLIRILNTSTYLALNKPKGYVTTRNDDKGRPTVMELMPNIPNIKPVGRLDYNTEGLLLFSNDGAFINAVTHPKFECSKVYYLRLDGQLYDDEKQKIERGITIEGKKTSPAKVKIISRGSKQTTLTIKIHEGRNRQIRKMFDSFDLNVEYLQRISIGDLQLGDLKIGAYRELTKKEIDDFK